MKENCLFCKIVNGEIPAEVIYEDADILGFKDIGPKAPVHFLFIPKKHIETVNDIPEEDVELFGKIIFAMKKTAGDNGLAEGGYRIVLNCNKDAGQEVFHVHFHLLGGRKFSWPPG